MKRVLVLDSNQRAALAITRSLGKHGYYVVNADTDPKTISGASRYSKCQEQYPSPYLLPDNFVSNITAIIHKHKIEIVLPVTDITTHLLLVNRADIPCTLPCPTIESYEKLTDKCSLFRLAIQLGLPTPRTLFLNHAGELDSIQSDLRFPIVIKPHRSRIHEDGKVISTSVAIVRNQSELLQHLSQTSYLHHHPLMLQEYISGEGQGLMAIYNDGTPLAFFAHRRIREKPPGGGVSVLSESIEVSPRVLESAKKLLDATGWHGVAMVEFKLALNGTPYLIEVNGRYWGSLQLAIDAGLDFPLLACQLASKNVIPFPLGYRAGNRLRWLLGDIDRLYLVLKGSYSLSRKISEMLTFLTPFQSNTRFEIIRLSDLKPFLVEIYQYFRNFIRR